MKRTPISLLSWLQGLGPNADPRVVDELSNARISRLVESKLVATKARRKRRSLGFGIGAVLAFSSVGFAIASRNSDTEKASSEVGAICWSGQYQASSAIHVGRDIDPINRCSEIMNMHFTSHKLHGCVDASGILNVVWSKESCKSLGMKRMVSSYPYSSYRADQLRAIIEEHQRVHPCETSNQFSSTIEIKLKDQHLSDWKLEVSKHVSISGCVIGIVRAQSHSILIIQRGNK